MNPQTSVTYVVYGRSHQTAGDPAAAAVAAAAAAAAAFICGHPAPAICVPIHPSASLPRSTRPEHLILRLSLAHIYRYRRNFRTRAPSLLQ